MALNKWLSRQKEVDPHAFKREYLGEFVNECSVQDSDGNHCPDKPEHYFEYNGREVGLCKRCYLSYKAGRFDRAKRNYGKRLYIA